MIRFLLRDLAHEVDAGRLPVIEAAGKVAEYVQRALKCVHVTFWSVSGHAGERVMRSVADYDGVQGLAIADATVFHESGGGFFDTLVREGCYVCGDTFEDPALMSVKETILLPFRIRALLAASYGGQSEAWGIITCTNDAARAWQSSEVTELRKCAAELSILRTQGRVLADALFTGDY